jgi:GT2 family glycosyltransferase
MRYVVEPRRGITYARNRAITEAGLVDFVAFIDDDEIPSLEWLDELIWAQARFSADVVSGPVVPRFAPDVADWVRSGGFFDARICATGTPRKTCASNNVLVAIDVFRRVPKFDDAFAVSGAEDTDFSLRASRAGYKIVWSQEAAVFEVITAERGNVAWLLRREYQTGNGWVFCEAAMDGRRNRLTRSLKACGHVVAGSAIAIGAAVLFDTVGVVRGFQRVGLGAGMLAALLGHRFLAYRSARTTFGKVASVAARME